MPGFCQAVFNSRTERNGASFEDDASPDFSDELKSLKWISDLPTIDELGIAGLIDTTNVDSNIFGTGKFYKEKQEVKKENIYSDIDEMLSSTLKNDDDK